MPAVATMPNPKANSPQIIGTLITPADITLRITTLSPPITKNETASLRQSNQSNSRHETPPARFRRLEISRGESCSYLLQEH